MDFSGSLFFSPFLPCVARRNHIPTPRLICRTLAARPQHYTCLPPATNHIFSFADPPAGNEIYNPAHEFLFKYSTSFPESKKMTTTTGCGKEMWNMEIKATVLSRTILLFTLSGLCNWQIRQNRLIFFSFFFLLYFGGKLLKKAGASVRRRHKYRREGRANTGVRRILYMI